jgi:predicted ester cyclase
MGTEDVMAVVAGAGVVSGFIETVWNGGRLDQVERFIAPEYAVEGVVVGPGWVRTNVGTFRAAFSDLLITIEQAVATEAQVALLVRIDAVHTGPWKGFAATGRAVSYREAGFWTVDPERRLIVAGEFVADTLMARVQMGIASPDLWRGPRPD